MMARRVARVLVSFLFAAAAAQAAAQVSPAPTRVQIKVSADEDVRGGIRTCLENELRGIPGMQLTDAVPEYTMSVIALKVVNQSRHMVGTTFSVVVTESAAEKIRPFADAHVPPEHREELLTLVGGTVRPVAHWVETASTADVAKVCRSMAQSFAADIEKRRRKSAVPVALP